MKKKTKDSCENCRFWQKLFGSTGACRRNPPTLVGAAIQSALREDHWHDVAIELWDFTEWPNTIDSEWCGEHERKR